MILTSQWGPMSRHYAELGLVGRLFTPRKRPDDAWDYRLPWACDNDCFQGLDERAFVSMCERAIGRPNLLWVTAPDVVGDANGTLLQFAQWEPILRMMGLPVAYVGQDGQESLPVPWDRLDCLFVGGTTAWKEGLHAEWLCLEAKRRGKLVHVGRVNTHRRARKVRDRYLADTIDGTAVARWCHYYLPGMVECSRYRQSLLDLEAT